jgi:hypothetical protein
VSLPPIIGGFFMEEKVSNSQLRLVFVDILKGCSVSTSKQFGHFYIKHLTHFDASDIDEFKSECMKKAKDNGLETEKEKLKELKKDELWTDQEDSRIIELSGYIVNLRHSKSKLFLKREINQIVTQIKDSEEEISKLNQKKEELVGMTCESFAAKKINEFYIFNSIFKDKEFKESLFEKEEFDELSNHQLIDLITLYNKKIDGFYSKNMKRIALNGFFLNHFYLSEDDAYAFYGKPICELTFFQAELFGLGKYFKSLMTRSKNKAPEDIMGDPDKIIEWYESSQNAQEAMERHTSDKAGGSSLVGASKEELQRLGASNDDEGTISLAKAAAKKGGQLNMEELMKLHGAE